MSEKTIGNIVSNSIQKNIKFNVIPKLFLANLERALRSSLFTISIGKENIRQMCDEYVVQLSARAIGTKFQNTNFRDAVYDTVIYIMRNWEGLKLKNFEFIVLADVCIDLKVFDAPLKIYRFLKRDQDKLQVEEKSSINGLKEKIDKLQKDQLQETFLASCDRASDDKTASQKAQPKKNDNNKTELWHPVPTTKGFKLYGVDPAEIKLEIKKAELEMLALKISFEEELSKERPLETKLKSIEKSIGDLEYKQQRASKLLSRASIQESFDRQNFVEERFFNPARTKRNETYTLAVQFQKRRLGDAEGQSEFEMDDIPVRRLVTAEDGVVKASLALFGVHDSLEATQDLGWHQVRSSVPSYYSPIETASLKIPDGGGSKAEYAYCHCVIPDSNHVGNFFATKDGKTKEIFEKLKKILDIGECKTPGSQEKQKSEEKQKEEKQKSEEKQKLEEKQKKLARFMLRYSKTGQPISVKELQEMNPAADVHSCTSLNGIFYHYCVKEIARRHLPKDDSHKFPWALAFSRSLQLIAGGYLNLDEVFASNAKYGPPTGLNIIANPSSIRKKIDNINHLYDEFILKKTYASEWIAFFKQHPDGKLVASKKQYRFELQETFGADSDTDGEGYETDDSS